MLDGDEDVFDSVTWESPSAATYVAPPPPTGPGFKQSTDDGEGPHDPKWEGYLVTSVKDPVKELADTKDAYVSYLVSATVCGPSLSPARPNADFQTNLALYSTPNPSSRRRFQDFVFLRNHLVKDFPACVVPALPDKHRLGKYDHGPVLLRVLMLLR